MNAPVYDRLRRNLYFARGRGLLHGMAAVVLGQQYARLGPTGGVPCRLAHHGVERLSFGFEMGLLSIAYLEPEIVMGVFTIQGTPCASREKSHSRSPRVTERVSA